MKLEELREGLKKLGYRDEEVDLILHPVAGGAPDPDPEKAKVGPRLRTAEELFEDFIDGVKAKGKRFIRRILSPKKDPIAAGASEIAEARFRSRMEEVLAQQRRRRKLARRDFTDWGREVEKLRPEDWIGPTVRKADKWQRAWGELEALRSYVASKIDAMPVDTAEARKAKMSANLECMRILGEFSKGVISEAEARSRVDAATRA